MLYMIWNWEEGIKRFSERCTGCDQSPLILKCAKTQEETFVDINKTTTSSINLDAGV